MPVLQDGESIISDSGAIAQYLNDTYSKGSMLFGCDVGQIVAQFINTSADKVHIFAFRPFTSVVIKFYEPLSLVNSSIMNFPLVASPRAATSSPCGFVN